ncbi:MAG TPA: hypothetical protein VGM10_09700 [Actinocrinis sp.]|jgi:hypothetical protein
MSGDGDEARDTGAQRDRALGSTTSDTPSGPGVGGATERSADYTPRHGDTGEIDVTTLRRALAEAVARDGHRRPGGAGPLADLKDAVTLRAALLVIAVLGLGVGFILSYVGALHHQSPRNLPVDVVAPAQIQAQTVNALNALSGQPLSPRLIDSAAAAQRRVADRTSMGAFVISASGTADTLYVASAAGPSLSSALTRIFDAVDAGSGRTVHVVDLVPLAAGDADGLAAFYSVIGWTVTGYLVASILGVSAGTRPATPLRAAIRLVVLALCAVAAGVVGAWIVQHILGALPGPYWPLVLVGALLVFAAGAVTVALQIAFGVVGIGVAVLLFVILGNPSAGGAYARPLLPPFWRAIGAVLTPGAGTDAARSIAYFGGARTGGPLVVLGVYCVVGLIAALLLAAVIRPRPTGDQVAA